MSHPLRGVTVASPCQADWNLMQGNEQVRFCGDCQLNVYNLSGMSREAAEALVLNTEGRLCVRFLQRGDGTIITQDCPIGLRAIHKRKTTRLSRVAAVITLVTVMGSFCVGHAEKARPGTTVSGTKQKREPRQIMMGKPMIQLPSQEPIMGNVATPPKNKPVMGEMIAPPPTAIQGGVAPIPPVNGEQAKAEKRGKNTSPKKGSALF